MVEHRKARPALNFYDNTVAELILSFEKTNVEFNIIFGYTLGFCLNVVEGDGNVAFQEEISNARGYNGGFCVGNKRGSLFQWIKIGLWFESVVIYIPPCR